MKFLIQTIDNKIVHDFSFTLIEAIKYNEWLGRGIEYETSDILLDPIQKDIIPVGSVEFVTNYALSYYNKSIKPINIPKSLFKEKYLKRECRLLDSKDIVIDKELFVKSNDKIKGFTSIVANNTTIPNGNYLVSEVIDIESEWRAFIYKNTLVGLQNYSGDFALFPDVKLITDMIGDYVEEPVAYTLDVGINSSGTFLIEVHDFFSCGLYGFRRLDILPFMFSQWWNEWLIRRAHV